MVHAGQTLWFLKNRTEPSSSPHVGPKHSESESAGAWFAEPEPKLEPSLVRPYALTAGRTDAGIDLALEAPVEALDITAKPPRWPKNDVRGQIVTASTDTTSVAEIASRLSLPIGATRFLVDELVTQGYLRVRAPQSDSIDDRRELINRTLRGLRELQASS
jgi:thioredoxin-dependent peroxiredoxin